LIYMWLNKIGVTLSPQQSFYCQESLQLNWRRIKKNKHTKGTKHTKPYFYKLLLPVGAPHQRGPVELLCFLLLFFFGQKEDEPLGFSSLHGQHYLFFVFHLVQAFLEVIQIFDLEFFHFYYDIVFF
jgi:hypothetical protein